MCNIEMSDEIRVAAETMYAYKLVASRKTADGWQYESQYKPDQRTPGVTWETNGVRLSYTIGKKVRSPLETTPGILCYPERPLLLFRNWNPGGSAWLKVRIPKGTRYRQASESYGSGTRIILGAETIVPLYPLTQETPK